MDTLKLRLVTSRQEAHSNHYQALSTGVHLASDRYVAPGAKITTSSRAFGLSSTRHRTPSKVVQFNRFTSGR